MAVLTPRHKNPRNEERQREIESVDLYFYFSFNWYIYIYIPLRVPHHRILQRSSIEIFDIDSD